jgi:(4S)-4-hydroxy-5-phosphonooxypentane-2,3-dione isomerase
MHVTLVHVHVVPERVADFLAASRDNHELAILEPGNLRFDVLQSTEDPAYFILYEAYESAEAATAHKSTAHYARWRMVVEPWMAEPRRGETFVGHAPEFD